MIDIKLSPPREGTRGGREQFKWDDLRTHDAKDLEHYLGGSIKLGVIKRKNYYYKHDWYLKKEDENKYIEEPDEIKLTKMYEDEIMQEMLGAKPKRLMLLKTRPKDVNELKKLLIDIPSQQINTDNISESHRDIDSRKKRDNSPVRRSRYKRNSRERPSRYHKSHRKRSTSKDRRSRSRHRESSKHRYHRRSRSN